MDEKRSKEEPTNADVLRRRVGVENPRVEDVNKEESNVNMTSSGCAKRMMMNQELLS